MDNMPILLTPNNGYRSVLVDTSEIDVEIRELVCLINEIPGVRTVASCAGHNDDIWGYVEGYISFTTDNQSSLESLLSSLPRDSNFTSAGNVFEETRRLFYCSCWYDRDIDPQQVIYRLTFGGRPVFYQRQLIDELVRGLLARQPESNNSHQGEW